MAPGAAHGGAGAEAAVPGDRGRPSVSVSPRRDRDVSARARPSLDWSTGRARKSWVNEYYIGVGVRRLYRALINSL